MTFITTGPSEFYRLRNKLIVRNITSSLGGQFSAILSTNSDPQASVFDISLWLNRFGMVCVGGCSFETSSDSLLRTESYTDLLWHSGGNNLCAVVNGDVVFLKITCMDKKSKKEISLGDENIVYNLNSNGSNSFPSLASNNLVIKLKESSRHPLNASSICQIDNGRCLLIGCRGMIVKYSWKGAFISRVLAKNSHCLFNTWQHGYFTLIQNEIELNGDSSPSKIVSERPQTEEESDGFLICDREEDSKVVCEKDVIISCMHSDKQCISSLLMADGSILFLESSGGKKGKTDFSCHSTSKIHPVMVLNSIKKTSSKKQTSTIVTDSMKLGNISSSLLDENYEQAISRVTNMCLIDSDTSSKGLENKNSALLVVTILTRHLPFNGPDAHVEEERPCIGKGRETLTLNVIRIELKSTGDTLNEQEKCVSLQCISTVLLQSQSQFSTSPTQNNVNSKNDDILCDQHSLSVMHSNESGVLGQGPMVLITVKGVISCRLVNSLQTIVFQIDTFTTTPGKNIHVSAAFGRLLIGVAPDIWNPTDPVVPLDGLNSIQEKYSKIHVVPLLSSAISDTISHSTTRLSSR